MKAMLGALVIFALAAGCSRHHDDTAPAQAPAKAADDTGAQAAQALHRPIDKANEASQALTQSADQEKEKLNEATGDAAK